MFKVQTSNTEIVEVDLPTKTPDILELTDEQLIAVAGGVQDYVAINDDCFNVDNGGFSVVTDVSYFMRPPGVA